jgi:hypothetical protein
LGRGAERRSHRGSKILRALPYLRRFRDVALDLHHGDDESEQDVLCQDRHAERHRSAFHVAMIVAALGRAAQARRATSYDDERDRVRAAYSDLRRNCQPPPEDAPGSAT